MSSQADGLAIAFQAIALARDDVRHPSEIALLHQTTAQASDETVSYAIVGLASMLVSIAQLYVEDPETYLNTLGPTVFDNYPDE